MAALTWPNSCYPQTAVMRIQKAALVDRSPFNGKLQTYNFNADRWVMSVTLPQRKRVLGGELEALAQRLAGGGERVNCWHFARPEPLGTMRGSPVLSSSRARGDANLLIATTAGATLRAGDCIGAGGQIFMIREDVTANGSGAMNAPLINKVRATIASGAAVTWFRPMAEFLCPSTANALSYAPGKMDGASIELEEVW